MLSSELHCLASASFTHVFFVPGIFSSLYQSNSYVEFWFELCECSPKILHWPHLALIILYYNCINLYPRLYFLITSIITLFTFKSSFTRCWMTETMKRVSPSLYSSHHTVLTGHKSTFLESVLSLDFISFREHT